MEGEGGSEEAKAVDQLQPELPPSSEEQEEKKEEKEGEKVYTPADFKFPQPMLKRQSVVPVFRSRKWFRHYHELVKLERNDPRPQQRAEMRAAKQAAVERGEVLEKQPRKKPVPAGEDGCNTRVDCALNNLYNLERHSRTGRCDFYQDFGHQEARSVRVGYWCKGCKAGMHPECYYSYHAVRYGVHLDDRYKINRSRRRQLSRKEIARAEGTFVWYKVPKDMHSSDDGYGSHGSQNGRARLSSGEGGDAELSDTGEGESKVSNATSPV